VSTENHAQTEPSSCYVDDEGAECWICLGEGPDDLGQPLRRDCSCRGEAAGFAHLSCIVEYAEQKSQQMNRGEIDQKSHRLNMVDLNNFREPWEKCANCHQNHQNELAVDLATGFVTFVEGKYPDNIPIRLESLVLKLEAIQSMIAHLKPKQKQEAKNVACQVLFMIGQMESKTRPLPKRILLAEAVTYSILGRIVLAERTKETAQEAMVCFEKCRDANKRIGNPNGVALADTYIAIAKSRREGGVNKVNIEEMVEKIRIVYDQRVEKLGGDVPMTLAAGLDLARALEKANRMLEAERLMTKLLAICRRVQGPDHALTKKAETHLKGWKVRYVNVQFQHQWFLFEALRYEEDYKKLVIKGPISTTMQRYKNAKKEEILTVDTSDTQPASDTFVVCHGLEGARQHCNGKIGQMIQDDSGRYEVHFEDKDLKPCNVKHANLHIIFELPKHE